MKNLTDPFKTYKDHEHDESWNEILIEISGGTKQKKLIIFGKNFNITLGNPSMLVISSDNTTLSMSDLDKSAFRDMLRTTKYYECEPTKREISDRDEYIKNDLDNEVKSL